MSHRIEHVEINQDTGAARAYHESTKLCYIDLRHKPPAYKAYPGQPIVPLPTDFPWPDLPTLDAVAAGDQVAQSPLDLTTLAQLLFFSAGLVNPDGIGAAAGEVHFRAAASAGALYPVEVYLVSGDIPELEAGVYHFSPADFTLRRLRRGDYRVELASAAASEEAVALAPATFILTALFWRSAWKYRVRSYRYCFWDAGTITANLLATAAAAGLPGRVVAGFVDDRVNSLLGIHPEREASLCLIPVGKDQGLSGDEIGDARPATRPNEPSAISHQPSVGLTADELNAEGYSEIGHIHAASSLPTEEEVVAWRSGLQNPPPQGVRPLSQLQYPGEDEVGASGPLGEVIQGRGSTRRFARQAIAHSQLRVILDRSTRGTSADFLGPGVPSVLDLYVVVNAVEGLASGSYYWSTQARIERGRNQKELKLLRAGAFREEAGHLCFEQALGADASAVVFLMADLAGVLGRYGNRGYRAAQLEAGIVGGKIYLCAHALGLGASGLTFYDDAVTSFFSPHAAAKSTMFVVALGVPARRNRVRPFRSRVAVAMDALARGADPPRSHRGPLTLGGLEEERNT
jgi:SagB-type dehydrogenase family enzyme